MADKPDEGAIRQHICEAQTIIEGEDQLPRYVARLELAECAEILAASLIKLPSLWRPSATNAGWERTRNAASSK